MRVSIVVGFIVAGLAVPAAAADPLPEGEAGIAANYPGDEGISEDPDVIFADDFEGYSDASELSGQWDAGVYQNDQIRLATESENVYAGNQALEFTVPQQDNELSNATDRTVSPSLDVLFLRYYSKFQPPYDVVGSSHNGSMISAQYFDNGQATPGVPADGTNKFLVNLENWRGEDTTDSPGLLNVYVYHPAQRGDYGDHFFPSGLVQPNTSLPFDFGPDFVARPEIIPELDRWYCYELMVQANTPGELDGRIAFWLDGVLAADFQNLRLRDVDSLKIDRFGLSFHIGSNPNGETKKWYDNVVAAGSYIGPISVGGADDTGATGSGGDDGSASGSESSPGTSSGGDAGSASSAGSGDASGSGAGSSGETDGTAAQGDDSGCGCQAGDRARGPRSLALLLLVTGLRRRRLAAIRRASTAALACGSPS